MKKCGLGSGESPTECGESDSPETFLGSVDFGGTVAGLAQNDLLAEDFRSRDRSWDTGRIALEFFAREKVRFWTMHNADELVGNTARENSLYWGFAASPLRR